MSDSVVVAELRARVAARDAVIEQLQGQLAVALAEIAELKRRLGQNSSNSSMPPSSDGLAKPAPKSLRGKSGRKPGGQAGHEGRTLSQVDSPDETVRHEPQVCNGCGAGLSGAALSGVVRRQVFEVPEPVTRVTEHQICARRCGCGTVTSAVAPQGVTAPAQYGPRAQALMVYLMAGQFLSADRTATAMGDLFGLPVSDGTVVAMTARHAGRLDEFCETVKALLRREEVVNADETGLRVAGRLAWVHSTSTGRYTLISVHERRGRAGIDAHGVLSGYSGIVVHDAWAPYDCYTTATHALCNAHLLREIQQVIDSGQASGWAAQARDTLLQPHTLTQTRSAGGPALDTDTLERLRARYTSAVAAGISGNSHRQNKVAQRHHALARRMFDRVEDYLRFAYDPRVPFSNNAAEQEIRMVKLRQKVSGCMRTLLGANHFAKIRSYTATARKHGISILDALTRLALDQPWLPATT